METDRYDWRAALDAVHGRYPNHSERPVVGITANFGDKGAELAEGYWQSVEAGGAIPIVLTPTDDAETILAALDRIDGLMLSGGGDINPLFLGEEPIPALGGVNARRDLWEMLLTRLAYDRQIPIFGICRGMQVLACALGGAVYQDIASCVPDASILVKHSQDLARHVASHTVLTEPGSVMAELLGEGRVAVNSFHHQAVSSTGSLLRATAHSSDGIIEAVESTEYKSVMGVQWHPETFITAADESMMPLFRHFAQEALSYRRARRFHNRHLTLDSHQDTPMFFPQGVKFDHRDPKVLVDLHKMTEGGLDASIMVAYLPQGERSAQAHAAANAEAHSILTQIDHMVHSCRGVELANSPADLYRLKAEGKRAIMRGIENGYAIGTDIAEVQRFRERGVVYMTLCHNGDNEICDSACRSKAEHGGVSAFGESVIREMNRVGMLVDLSHAADTTFYDAIDISEVPVVCSHSSARALCDHARNLNDDQLRALAEAGGVAQVTLYRGFLRSEGEATIRDGVQHLMHMIDVAGIEAVGIGTDFDGDGGVRGCASSAELINFTRKLMAERFSTADLEMIWGGNFLRVMQIAQDYGSIVPKAY